MMASDASSSSSSVPMEDVPDEDSQSDFTQWSELQRAIREETTVEQPDGTASSPLPQSLLSVLASLKSAQKQVKTAIVAHVHTCIELATSAQELESWLRDDGAPVKPNQTGRAVLMRMLANGKHTAIMLMWRQTFSLWEMDADRQWWKDNIDTMTIKSFNQLKTIHTLRDNIKRVRPEESDKRTFWHTILSASRSDTETNKFINNECPPPPAAAAAAAAAPPQHPPSGPSHTQPHRCPHHSRRSLRILFTCVLCSCLIFVSSSQHRCCGWIRRSSRLHRCSCQRGALSVGPAADGSVLDGSSSSSRRAYSFV